MLLQPCFVAEYMEVFNFSLDYFSISFYHPLHYLAVNVDSAFFLSWTRSQQSVFGEEIKQGHTPKCRFVTMKLGQIYSLPLLSINFWVLLGNEAEVSASCCME